MDSVLAWIKQVFVISVLSEIILHLLPNEKYESFVRLVCGILMTSVCVSPLINLMSDKAGSYLDLEYFQNIGQMEELRGEIQFSKDMAEDKILEQYLQEHRDFIEKSVLETGLTPVSVDIIMDTDAESESYAQIQKIDISVSSRDREKFYAQQDSGGGSVIAAEVIGLKETLADYYELNPGQVNIYLAGNGGSGE